ncbi:nucleoside-triphosphatase THEP1 isoform X3 [Sesamum indicum]|uniref:Nucleoside-triphosphatase THEP1 isoform X3 n=1 Tax=Sesamum indicum TaxID=4182 RepID=A0A6I9U7X9_SESIN|nr:nucleoside-triphosphatase THEP1 isoform X3 [Sesamum indicum]
MLSCHWPSGSGKNYSDNPSAGGPQTIESQLKDSGFLYSRESQRWPNVGRYKVDVSSFESLALPELQVKVDTDLFIIDEVGKMELFSSSFFPAVLRVLESNIPLLASVPIPKSGRDIPGVARLKNHPGATMCMLNTSNRDAMKEQIYSNLINLLQNQ